MPDPSSREETSEPERIRAIPARHPGRWVATAFVLLLGALLIVAAASNERFRWGRIGQIFTSNAYLHGLAVTLELTASAMVIGIILGIILAVMRLSPVPVISGGSWIYIWFFRGWPVLVQLLFWYSAAALIGPEPAVGIPFTHVVLFHINANAYITPINAAILGLGLNEGAYMAEIVRAGIISVEEGQTEAAQSLGMTRLQTMRLVVLPQAMRVIIPPTGNETISMLKTSSLAFVVGVQELLGKAEIINGRTFEVIQTLIAAAFWYMVLTTILTIGQYYVERHYGRGTTRGLPPTPVQKFRALLARNLRTIRPHEAVVAAPGEHR